MLNGRMEERRAFVAEVDVLHAGEPAPRRLWGNNLSEKGMFLQGVQGFRKGQRLSLRFDLNGEEIFVRSAEIIWLRAENDEESPVGIGLHFNDLSISAREQIRTYVLKTDVDTRPPAMGRKEEAVMVSAVTEAPPPRAGFAASLLPLKSPRPVTMRPHHRSVVQNLSHAVTLLRRGPVLSTPPSRNYIHSFLEPDEGELLQSSTIKQSLMGQLPASTLCEDGQLFSDESPSLYEQETEIIKKTEQKNDEWKFDDKPTGLRGLDGKDEDTHQVVAKREGPEEQPFLHFAKEVKKEQLFEHGELAAADLPKSSERRQKRRNRKKISNLMAMSFLVVMGTLGFFLFWKPAPIIPKGEKPNPSAHVISDAIPKPAESPPKPEAKNEVAALKGETNNLVDTPPQPPEKTTKASAAKAIEDTAVNGESAQENIIEKVSGKTFYTPKITTEWGRAHIGIKGGKVVRSFGLVRPPRVVVDLENAQHPGNLTFKIQRHGVEKIRIGRPDGQLVRIVILTNGQRRPREISSLKRKGKLSIAWQ